MIKRLVNLKLLLIAVISTSLVMAMNINAHPHEKFWGMNVPPISNVFFFGDSQTDIGNVPESMTAYNPTSGHDGNGTEPFTFNTYVPISNPVDTRNIFIVPGTGIKRPAESNNNRFLYQDLPDQLQICDNSNPDKSCADRQYRSINWVTYLMYTASKKELINNGENKRANLRPWIVQYKETTQDGKASTLYQSVDYAWVGALTPDLCSDMDQNQQERGCGTENGKTLDKSLYQAQQRYRNHQSPTDALENNILSKKVFIPGVKKQIQLFKEDLAAGRVKIDKRSLFIVWTGANDVAYHYKKDIIDSNNYGKFYLFLTKTLPDQIAGKHDSVVTQLVKAGAKNIIIVGQYNLGLIPEYYSNATVLPFNFLAKLANSKISENVVERNKEYGGVSIKYVNIQQPINYYLLNGHFMATVGQRCDSIENKRSSLLNGDAVSCHRNEIQSILSYGWWNDAHLATQMNQVIASTILKAVEN